MPSNVFLYQLPLDVGPLSPADRFVLDDGTQTLSVQLSTIRESIFDASSIPSDTNFRIKEGRTFQLKDMATGLWRTLVAFNGSIALSGAPES